MLQNPSGLTLQPGKHLRQDICDSEGSYPLLFSIFSPYCDLLSKINELQSRLWTVTVHKQSLPLHPLQTCRAALELILTFRLYSRYFRQHFLFPYLQCFHHMEPLSGTRWILALNLYKWSSIFPSKLRFFHLTDSLIHYIITYKDRSVKNGRASFSTKWCSILRWFLPIFVYTIPYKIPQKERSRSWLLQ